MSVVRIAPTQGLCNRLRVVFSFRKEALLKGWPLEVEWHLEEECVGHFLDVFEPVDGVDFVSVLSGEADYRGCYQCCPPDYADLRPNEAVRKFIRDNLRELGDDFVAVHVRRTDHSRHAIKRECFTPDEEFHEFVEGTQGPLFLATDEQEVQHEFRLRYGDRLKATSPFEHPDKLRQSSLMRSVADLYTCVLATQFKGSGWSSFSRLIITLRNGQGYRASLANASDM